MATRNVFVCTLWKDLNTEPAEFVYSSATKRTLMKQAALILLLALCAAHGQAQSDCLFENGILLQDTLEVPCNECGTLQAELIEVNETTSYTVESIADPAPPYPTNTGQAIIGATDDIYSGVIPIGFPFCFFGQTYTGLVIGSNGVVTFDLSEANQGCPWQFTQTSPNAGLPTNAIFGVYHDINPASCGNVRWQAYGESPCRTFVINFDDVCLFSCTGSQSTSQIVLYEATNVIEVYVVNKPACAWNSGSSLVGIQNATGTLGFSPPGRNTGNWSASNEAWRFEPDGNPDGALTWYDSEGVEIGTGEAVEICPEEPGYVYAALDYELCTAPESSGDCAIYSVNVSTGSWPTEVSWDLLDAEGAIVLSGGAGFSANPCLPNGCYTLIMSDSFGDGWNGSQFTISSGGSVLATATIQNGFSATAEICLDEFEEEPDDGEEPGPLDLAFIVDSIFVDVALENLEIELTVPEVVCTTDADTLLVADIADGEWSASCEDCIDSEGVFSIETLDPGDYTVYYAVQGICDIVVDSATIAIEAPPILSFSGPEIICAENEPVQIEANEPNGTWEAACDGCIDPVTGSFNPAGLAPGTYEITYTAGPNCPATASTSIEVDETLTAELTPVMPFCESESVNLEATAEGGFWTADCGECIDSSSGLFSGPISGSGVFTVTYDFDSFCSIPVSTVVEVAATVDAGIEAVPELCETGSTYTLVAADPEVAWTSNCGTCLNNDGVFDPQVSGPGTFTVSSSIDGICTDTDEVQVVVLAQRDATITLPEEICLDAGTFTLNAADGGGIWSTSDCFDCLNEETGQLNLENAEEGSFQVTYTIEGLCGDEDTAETFLFPCEVDAPNIFTPNGDGDNDVLLFPSLQYFPNSRLEVRNRWGQLVYENGDYGRSNNWDGDGLSDGTYYYTLMIGSTGEIKRGTVTIRR